MLALSRQKIDIEIEQVKRIVLYESGAREMAIRLAKYFRGAGENIQLIRKPAGQSVLDYVSYARRNQVGQLLYLTGEGGQTAWYQAESGEVKMRRTEEFLKDTGADKQKGGWR